MRLYPVFPLHLEPYEVSEVQLMSQLLTAVGEAEEDVFLTGSPFSSTVLNERWGPLKEESGCCSERRL